MILMIALFGISTRGATLICVNHTLSGIPANSRQLTYAIRHVILSRTAFEHALSGPFANQRSARLSPARTLWECPFRFISTSTVYTMKFLFERNRFGDDLQTFIIKTQLNEFVNRYRRIFVKLSKPLPAAFFFRSQSLFMIASSFR